MVGRWDDIDNWNLVSTQCNVFDLFANGTKKTELPISNQTNGKNIQLDPWQLAECTFVNDMPTGYITGGGRVNLNQTISNPNNPNALILLGGTELIDKVTHGFQLHCNMDDGPNNFEVNWLGNKFHLEQLVTVNCIDDGSINEPPPNNGGNPNSRKPTLDIYHGEGWGRYNGECGAFAKWTIDDNGEPGKADHIIALQVNFTGSLVLNINPGQLGVTNSSVSGTWNDGISDDSAFPWLDLESGNHQWTPHPSKKKGPTQTTPCPLIP